MRINSKGVLVWRSFAKNAVLSLLGATCRDNTANALREMCNSNFKFTGKFEVDCPRTDRCQFNPKNVKWCRCNWCKRNERLTKATRYELYDQYHRVDQDPNEVLVEVEQMIAEYRCNPDKETKSDPMEFIKELHKIVAEALGMEEHADGK